MTLVLRWLSRDPRRHGHPIAMIIDAKTVLFALEKGRNSAPSLRHAIRRCSALIFARNWAPRYAFAPSKSNPADWPSRGLIYRQSRARYRNVDSVATGSFRKLSERFVLKQDALDHWLSDWCRQHWPDASTEASFDRSSSHSRAYGD